ncbi:hypothetical protein [uncultured Rubinisphaera sp.]|uniref:hypothetical protein n=1 Tax=uncultured Rubinisphaera sp. TaxID=1678686 RepID=UPI000EDE9E7B|nr:hypothetical protein [Planctomycetaceae bacterium]|tara:strand:- start:93 stop:521 length:429 start_codon:yes stop_codon:yes gene_type:complete
MPEYTKIEGRVAQILNARELVINVGKNSRVKTGQIFAVMAESPIEIRDPETGELLDRIDREKVRVKITEVREKISICSTYRKFEPLSNFTTSLSTFKLMAKAMNEPRDETLRIEDSSTPPPLKEEESYVKVSDRVVSIPLLE